ncbi:MAG TPA: hypothetical protein VLB69_06450 [Rudaea sp.]|nr:hypothetical protein [Rudaea sp.]
MKVFSAGVAALFLAACSSPDAGSRVPVRSVADIPVANAGFEEPGTPDRIPGWILSQHAGPQAYEMTQDATAPFAGHASFRMRRTRNQVYGLLYQEIAIDAFAGKTVELSAMARTADVGPHGWLIYIDMPGRRETSDALTGTTDWRAVHVRAKLPPDAHRISIGVLLLDAGTGWLDDVHLKVVEL